MSESSPQADDQALDWETFNARYAELLPRYQRLSEQVSGDLRSLLGEHGISTLEVSSRLKSAKSAFEKISRKSYVDPFEQIEDWCGVRVICYYPSDVRRIVDLVRDEFKVHTEEDTSSRLAPHEFGYRSTHLILSIKDSWLHSPRYRTLGQLKTELQVRTILMHAWAEIEHKLAYKGAEQVPDEFRRKLYRLSAKFEEADEQFEDLRMVLTEYRTRVKSAAQEGFQSLRTLQLNLDTLAVLLDAAYPQRKRSEKAAAGLLKEIADIGLTMNDLVDAVEAQRPFLEKIEKLGGVSSEVTWAQVGAFRNALDIGNERYYQSRSKALGGSGWWAKRVKFGRELIGSRSSATERASTRRSKK